MTIDEVWSGPSAIAAAIAAALFSLYLWVVHIRRPSYSGRALWAMVAVDCLVGSFAFTVSQAIASLYLGDPSWVRVLSRYGMWIVFAAALGLCLAALFRLRHRKAARL